jgi:hypothetical protein
VLDEGVSHDEYNKILSRQSPAENFAKIIENKVFLGLKAL